MQPEVAASVQDFARRRADDANRRRKALQESIRDRHAELEERKTLLEAEIARLRAEYAEEHKMAEEEMRRMRSEINALAPIRVLPQEMLEKIFDVYASIARREYMLALRKINSNHQPEVSWWKEHFCWVAMVKITHVCVHWRTIALSFAPLWSWIVPVNVGRCTESRVQRILSLSRAHPLTVEFRHVDPRNDSGRSRLSHLDDWSYSALRLALLQLPRIRALKLPVDESVCTLLASEAMSPLELGAPLLEDLEVVIAGDTSPSTLPKFTDDSLPRLRSLAVVQGSYALTTTLISPSLTNLAICFPRPFIPQHTLLRLLQSLPQLERLVLKACEEPSDPEGESGGPATTRPRISLPLLKELKYVGVPRNPDIAAFTPVIDRIDYPPHAKLEFSLRGNVIEDTTALFPVVLEKVRGVVDDLNKNRRPRSMYVDFRARNASLDRLNVGNFRIWSTAQAFRFSLSNDHLGNDTPDLVLSLTERPMQALRTVATYIERFLTTLDVSGVTSLGVEGQSFWQADWATLCRAMPRVERLTLQAEMYGCLWAFFNVFGVAGSAVSRDEDGGSTRPCTVTGSELPVPFPQLRFLHIIDLTAPQDVDNLVTCLEFRKSRNTGLTALELSGSGWEKGEPEGFLLQMRSLEERRIIESLHISGD